MKHPLPEKSFSDIQNTVQFILAQLKSRKYRRGRLIEQLTSTVQDMEDYKSYLKELISYYEQDRTKSTNKNEPKES